MVWQRGAMVGAFDKNKRQNERKTTNRPAVLHYKGTQIPVVLKDISQGGSQIELAALRAHTALDGPMRLDIPGVMQIPVEVRWRSSTKLGIAFDLPDARKAVLAHQIVRMTGGLVR